MIVRGKISTINKSKKTYEVILVDFENVVTRPLKWNREGELVRDVQEPTHFIERELKVNDIVYLAAINDDLNDLVII